jgi:hypothetical protein
MIQYKIAILLLLSLVFVNSSAQRTPYDSEVYWGLTAGATASTVYFKPQVDQGILIGYNGGAVFRYIGRKNLGLQAEILYSQRGWKELNNLYTRQLNYIEIPFLTHFNFGTNFRSFINFGPKFSYLLSEEVLVNNTINSTELQHSTTIKRPFEYGLVLGAGFYVRLKKQVFQLEARGNYSAVDLYPNKPGDTFNFSNSIYGSLNISWLIQTK